MAFIKNPSAATLIGTETEDVIDSTGYTLQTLYGGAGNDVYVLDPSDVIVEGIGQGTDTVSLSYAVFYSSDYTLGDNIENLTYDMSGIAGVMGVGPNSDFFGNSLANVISVVNDAGGLTFVDNILDGGAGNDTLSGGVGNDIYYVDSTTDVVIENAGAGVDEVRSTAATYTLSANVENLSLQGTGNIAGVGNTLANVLTGNTGNNTLDGGDGHDTLIGGAGNDSLVGGAGNDSLQGDAGVDTLVGGAGDDTYKIDSAADVVTEIAGGGSDRVVLADSVLSYTLAAEVETLYMADEDGATQGKSGIGNALNNFIMGTAWADNISGAAGNDVLDGGDGTDTLSGGLGNDTFIVNHMGDRVVEAAGEGTDQVYSSVSHALSSNVENLSFTGNGNLEGWGNELANVLTGNAGANTLYGGAGADTLDGGLGVDRLFGGAGNDLYYTDGSDSIHELANEGIDTVFSSGNVDALYDNVENLTLTGSGNLRAFGNDLANVINGNSGNNTLYGGGGVDTLAGGAGNDTYYVGAGDTVTEAAGAGLDTVIASGSYTLGLNVENLVLEAGAGAINGTGNTDNNAITGNSGTNSLDGGAGNDFLVGGYGADTLIGGIGDDTLDGGAMGDQMKGGAGNDVYYVNSTADVVDESTLSGGAGTDTIVSSLRNTDLSDTNIFRRAGGATGADVVENVRLDGSAANVIGNALDNTFWGNAGANVMTGGTGNDTYYVDLRDTVIESSVLATEIDKVVLDVGLNGVGMGPLTIDMATRYANVENLTLLGSRDTDVIGTSANNVLVGNAGNNLLFGGAGSDTMIGGAGNDTYQVSVATDVVTELANEGIDTVESQVTYTLGANVENLKLTGVAATSGTGNELNNLIVGNGAANVLTGAAGNDTLSGGSGNDTLTGGDGDDQLDGGSGIDSLTGGLGNDTYVVDSASDAIVEIAAQGTDTVIVSRALSSYTLAAAADVENLQAESGSGAVTLVGNALSNTIRGAAGGDSLVGGGGNDTFDGRDGGNDTMVGGTGTDTFNFSQLAPSSNSLGAGDSIVGGSGADVVNATISGAVGAFSAAGVETLNVTTALASATLDLSNVVQGVNNLSRINVAGTEDLSITHAGSAGGLNVPVVQLNDLSGRSLSFALHDASGIDQAQFDIVRSSVALNTADIETVVLNNLASPLGAANAVDAVGIAGADIYVKGVGALDLTVADQSQPVFVDGFAGKLSLAMGTDTGSDTLAIDLYNVQGTLAVTTQYETLSITAGDAASALKLEANTAAIVNVLSSGTGAVLTLRDVAVQGVDARAFDGQSLSVNSIRDVGGIGTAFTIEKSGVAYSLAGGNGGDIFYINVDTAAGNISAFDNDDRIDGGGGTDMVDARIDGLNVGTSGALRFANIELFEFENQASGLGGTAGAAIDGAALGNASVTLIGFGTQNSVADTLFVNLSGGLVASGYSGDVTLYAAANGVGNTYTFGAGDHQIFGETTAGVGDTFTFNSDFNGKDFVSGYDVGGGDVLNATLASLSGADGMLRIEGVETLNFTVTGANIIDASNILHAATINLTGAGSIALSNLDGDGVVVNAMALGGTANLSGGAGADWLKGSASAANTLNGGAGADTLNGGGVADSLSGGDGADSIVGGDGADTLLGGDGNDWVEAGAGNDSIAGGAGFDTVTYEHADAGVVVAIDAVAGSTASDDGDLGADSLSGIEAVIGSLYNDSLTGSSTATLHGKASDAWESFAGSAGNDTIDGGAGDGHFDRVDYSMAGSGVSVNLGTGTASDGQGGTDTLANIDMVAGSNFADTLTGGSSSKTLTGTLFESFYGGWGNDAIDGAGGLDQADYQGDIAGVLANLGLGFARDGWGTTDTLSNIEMLRGSRFADTLIGGATANNALEAFEGGAGDDMIDGGSGFDRVDYRGSTAGVTVNLQTGIALDGFGGTDALFNIEGVSGSDFADSITGSDSLTVADVLRGNAGNDTINGGLGNDQVDYSADYDDNLDGNGVAVNLGATATLGAWGTVNAGTARDGWNNTDTLSNIEDIAGSLYNDYLVGSTGANVIKGLAGNDTLDGGAGNDTLDGGAGNDVYYVDSVSDVVIEAASAGNDLVNASVTHTLGAEIEALTLTGTAAINGTGNSLDNLLTGNSAANLLSGLAGLDTLIGGAGNDTLIGGTGADTLDGGADTDMVDYSGAAGGVTLSLQAGTASDDGSGAVDTLSNIEQVRGSAFADALTGDGSANRLEGLAGNDTLDGGSGADVMLGGLGNDSYAVDNAGDVVTEVLNEGTDTVTSSVSYTLTDNVENLVLATGSSSLAGTGNILANAITGNDGNNTLNGLAGNDTLDGGIGSDYLRGGAGLDVLTGGADIDHFVFAAGAVGDTIASIAGDTVADFSSTVDKLDFDNALFTAIGPDGALNANAFYSAAGVSSGHDADDRLVYNTTTGGLYYDADGNGVGASVLVATFTGSPTVAAADIQII